MSDDERSSSDRLPRVLVFDGDAESYLDADEAYQRLHCVQSLLR